MICFWGAFDVLVSFYMIFFSFSTGRIIATCKGPRFVFVCTLYERAVHRQVTI